MKKNILMIFINYCLLIFVNCYCEGNHNRDDLDKKECARYEIEDYECCYIYFLMTDLVEKECLVYTKNIGEKLLGEAFMNSPLNIFGGNIECSFRYLSFGVINVSIFLLFLIL